MKTQPVRQYRRLIAALLPSLPPAGFGTRGGSRSAAATYRAALASEYLGCSARFCVPPSEVTRLTVSRTAVRIFSNWRPVIQSWGATHGPPQATTLLSAR